MTARRHRIERGPLFCHPENRRQGLMPRISPAYCKDPDCKFKVRGLNHEDGDHHNQTVPKCRRGSW